MCHVSVLLGQGAAHTALPARALPTVCARTTARGQDESVLQGPGPGPFFLSCWAL